MKELDARSIVQIKIGDRVILNDDTNRFNKGHEFTVYGYSYRGLNLIDDNGNKMDECLFITDKIELIPIKEIRKRKIKKLDGL